MDLPILALATDTVPLGDIKMPVRGLTRAEAFKVQTAINAEDVLLSEALIISFGTDKELALVEAWMVTAPAGAVGTLTDRIAELSGMSGAAHKSGEENVPPRADG